MSSTTSMPSAAMLNWNPLDNQSIIMIVPQIKDVNKVHLSEEKMDAVWMEWGKTLSIAERLFFIQHKDEILKLIPLSHDTADAVGAPSSSKPLPVVIDVTADAPGTPKKKNNHKSCSTCSSLEHTKRRCTVRCSSCNVPGHASKECPTNKRKADDASVDENLPKKKKAKTNNDHEVPMVSQPAPTTHTEFALILPGLVGANGLVNSLTVSPRSSMPTPIEHVADSEE